MTFKVAWRTWNLVSRYLNLLDTSLLGKELPE